jgi:ubiquinone/menaquinone biosynthesis C-methylase UbiE
LKPVSRNGGLAVYPSKPADRFAVYATPELAAEYSALADAYARLWGPVIKPMALPMLDMLPLAQAREILDVGAGTGELFEDLSRRAPRARIMGVDRSEGMLRVAQARGIPRLAVMDAQRLAISDAAFDVAVCIFVLFHLPNPLQGLRELRRVLRPGAQIGTVTWGDDPGAPGAAVWREALDVAGAAPDPRDPIIMQHKRMNTEAKLAALLREAGFTEVRTQHRRAEHQFTVESLLKVQLRCGLASRRLTSLSSDARARCRARVEERIRSFSLEKLVYRPEVIFAVARR